MPTHEASTNASSALMIAMHFTKRDEVESPDRRNPLKTSDEGTAIIIIAGAGILPALAIWLANRRS